MAKSLLSSLKVTARPEKNTSILSKRKDRLLRRLDEQRQLAQGLADNKPVTIYREKWVKNTEGVQELERIPRKTPKWFYQSNGTWFLEIRIGTTKIELEKDCTAIEVGDKNGLVDVIDTIVEAVKAGELDKQIEAAETAFSKKK